MRTKELTKLLRDIDNRAKQLKDLAEHTNDPDLLRTAVNSLHNATKAFLEATDA